jgi:adenine-specific DNA-methyltransferase
MAIKTTAHALRLDLEPNPAGQPSRMASDQTPGGHAPKTTDLNGNVSLARKISGAYYTPDNVTGSLIRWAVRSNRDRMLDPACGDGRFIVQHPNSVGVDQDLVAVGQAGARAPDATIHHADFFEWAADTEDRFDCAVGNPPFIRYQHFRGEVRNRALSLCKKLGVVFSALTSSWAPFLVAAASLLQRGGRLAFVVPAEIGHAPYAAPAIEYLVEHFARVQVIAVRDKLFPGLSEDCWLLYADGFGARTHEILFTAMEKFHPSAMPPRPDIRATLKEWRETWKRRLRPLIISSAARRIYEDVAEHHDTRRFGELASIGIGYVSGDNDFFHLRPSEAAAFGLQAEFLRPSVRNGRYLTGDCLTTATVEQWSRADEPILLLNIPKAATELPRSVRKYLDRAEGQRARQRYKCRNRQPWYSVPDIHVPDFFLSYLSGRSVNLVRNEAGVTCTNALHYVRLKNTRVAADLVSSWRSSFTRLSCEIEGHPLGGGVLKLEPREAAAVLLTADPIRRAADQRELADAVTIMQVWRHYC